MRIWLGVMWIQAGTAKLSGAENPGFLHKNGAGAGAAGFASQGVAAYSWWAIFLHSFVVPNTNWITILIAVSEFAIGVALALGLFTRIAALASLLLLFTYVMSGTASVCAFYALLAIVILATWRPSSWIGVGGLTSGYRQRHSSTVDVGNVDSLDIVATEVSGAVDVIKIASKAWPASPSTIIGATVVSSRADEPVAVN